MNRVTNKSLFAACNYWSSPYQVGSHEIAKTFLRNDWKAAFISDPISPFHHFAKNKSLIEDRRAIHNGNGMYDYDKRLWAYVPYSYIAPNDYPLLNTNYAYKKWPEFTNPSLLKLMEEKGFIEVNFAYFDSIPLAPLYDKLKIGKSVMRIADNNEAYGKRSKAYKEMEQRLAQQVDLVVYTARNLERYVDKLSPKRKLYLPNGVDYRHFQIDEPALPEEYTGISEPRVVYVGDLQLRFDWEVVLTAAQKLPDVSFVLIGNNDGIDREIADYPNIYLLGTKPYADIPKYITNAQAGIIPFAVSKMPELINNVNPIKLYQYLACGLPVVSAKWDEVADINPPVSFYDNADGFADGIKKALQASNNSNELKSYAKSKDWNNVYNKLMSHL